MRRSLLPVIFFVCLLLVFPALNFPDTGGGIGIRPDLFVSGNTGLLKFQWRNLFPKVIVKGDRHFITRVERRGNFCVLNIYCSASGKTMTISAGGFTFISRDIVIIFDGDEAAALVFIGTRSIPNRDVFLYHIFSDKLIRLTFTPSNENFIIIPDNTPGPDRSFILETVTDGHRFKYRVSLTRLTAALFEKTRLPARIRPAGRNLKTAHH